MEKVILDIDSFIGKNEEKVFAYKMMKPKFNKQTKKFEDDEIFKVFSKDEYLKKIYTYGLAYSNFGFMGNAVVSALFPELFMDYLLFTLPFSILVYVWIIPALLIPKNSDENVVCEKKNISVSRSNKAIPI